MSRKTMLTSAVTVTSLLVVSAAQATPQPFSLIWSAASTAG
jgi:hypothetical protein